MSWSCAELVWPHMQGFQAQFPYMQDVGRKGIEPTSQVGICHYLMLYETYLFTGLLTILSSKL